MSLLLQHAAGVQLQSARGQDTADVVIVVGWWWGKGAPCGGVLRQSSWQALHAYRTGNNKGGCRAWSIHSDVLQPACGWRLMPCLALKQRHWWPPAAHLI